MTSCQSSTSNWSTGSRAPRQLQPTRSTSAGDVPVKGPIVLNRAASKVAAFTVVGHPGPTADRTYQKVVQGLGASRQACRCLRKCDLCPICEVHGSHARTGPGRPTLSSLILSKAVKWQAAAHRHSCKKLLFGIPCAGGAIVLYFTLSIKVSVGLRDSSHPQCSKS